MLKLSSILTSATTGEVTPLLEGRVDLAKFAASFRKMENFYLYPHGPYTKREGSYFVCEAKHRDKKCRLIPFTFSLEQSYILEFGEYYIRVFMDGGSVAETEKNITGASKAAQCVITSTGHGYANGDEVYIDEIVGMVELNGKRYRVSDKATDNFKIKDLGGNYVNSSGFTSYSSGGKAYRIYEIVTPYDDPTLFDIQYTQSADVMYVTYGEIPVYKLTRTDHTAWTIAAVDFIDGPYLPSDTVTQGITPGAVSGSTTLTVGTKAISAATKASPVVITSNSHGKANGDLIYIAGVVGMTELNGRWFVVTNKATNTIELYDLNGNKIDGTGYTTYSSGGTMQEILFTTGDVNRLIRFLCTGSVYRWAKITAYTSGTVVTATIKGPDALPDTNEIKTYRMGYWCVGNGYPFSCTFHEQRMMFGGCPEYPNTVWGTVNTEFENFTPGVLDADPVTYTLATDQVNAIRWLSSGTFLSIGAGDAEFSLKSNSLNEPLTPTNVKADRESTIGSAYIMPLRIGRSVMYVQTHLLKLFEYAYRYTEEGDTFASTDLSLLAEHITESGIVDLAYQKEPNSIIWCALANGTLIGLTYLKEHDVLGWHRHDIGGGMVESIACIPGVGHTELWMSVLREVDGIERRYIEYLNPTDYKDAIEDAFFVDCGLTVESDTPFTEITGLDHLEGETVTILADGSVHPKQEVVDGMITLTREALKVHVGLKITSIADYQRAEPALSSGTVQGKKKRIPKIVLRVLRALGLKVGPDENTLAVVRFSRGAMGDPSPLYSGDKEVALPGGYGKDGKFTVVHDEPLPCTIICAVPTYAIGEE